MNDMTLDIFRRTIRIKWNAQSSKLKNDLINYLVNLFGDTFNKSRVTSKVGAYLKYVRDQYRVHIQKNSRYEHPLMILDMEWKALLKDAKEKTLRKNGKIPPDTRRYVIL